MKAALRQVVVEEGGAIFDMMRGGDAGTDSAFQASISPDASCSPSR